MKKELYNLRATLGAFKQDIYLNALYPFVLKHRARTIGRKEKIDVVFFAMNVAMWRYQGVYDLLSMDNRFNCHIVLTVPKTFMKEQQNDELVQLRKYFDSKGIEYIDHDDDLKGSDVKGLINPDILFYPQPYDDLYLPNHDYGNFLSKLLCYMPYSVNVIEKADWLYNLNFHNLAWKIYCPLKVEKENAMITAKNHGRNWFVSGYSNLDNYLSDVPEDVWKIKDRSVKRLIWAPHFTLSHVTWLKPRSNFLWMAQLMLDLAIRYKSSLQIAFKPHPRLKSELYRHPEWGKERTDNYYHQWETMENTQLETGGFVDLFMTSDAMIHDCASFTAEYLYVNRPVAFVAKNFEDLKSDHSLFGCEALNQHYLIESENQVRLFVKQVLLEGEDTKKEQRTRFFNDVLKPNVKGSTSQFIVDDIKKSLGIQ